MVHRALIKLEGSLFVLRKFFDFFILGGRGFSFSLKHFFKLFNSGGKVVCLNFVDVFLGSKFGSWNLCCSDSKF